MEIDKTFKRFLIKEPFYGLFAMGLPRDTSDKVKTLAVCKRGINCELLINPEFWEKHTDDEQIALLKHEISHIALQHMFIYDSFGNHELFNIAADAEVNSYIEDLPECAVTPTKLQLEDGKGTKYYYEELLKRMQQSQSQNPQSPCNGGQGGSDSQQDGENGNNDDNSEEGMYPQGSQFSPTDDHGKWKDFEDMPEATKQLMANNINRMLVETAEQVMKSRGTIPGHLVSIIEKLKEKRPEVFNWKAYFRRLLGSIYDINVKMTRRKDSKRFPGAAGIQHRKKVSMLVAVDTSASVNDRELAEFFCEINHIYKAGARVTIIECDTQINKVVEYDGKNIPEIAGRGGTDLNPPVEWYIKHKKDYAAMVYFTDGYAPLPDKSPSDVVWIITSNGQEQDYPGKTVYIPKGNVDD